MHLMKSRLFDRTRDCKQNYHRLAIRVGPSSFPHPGGRPIGIGTEARAHIWTNLSHRVHDNTQGPTRGRAGSQWEGTARYVHMRMLNSRPLPPAVGTYSHASRKHFARSLISKRTSNCSQASKQATVHLWKLFCTCDKTGLHENAVDRYDLAPDPTTPQSTGKNN